ncbi:DUF3459 domain-containing protein [Paraburkholderia piptadeniae]|uniref:DUF3459 domain-containing protein n=1 Tax=Paraburkholderia piptadeniae TaxID=1701573 RepID=UPI001F41B6BC|nr:DUF3459 domain-containing protein [Paraburkholderia piptadeniae]
MSLYRRLLTLRRNNAALVHGTIENVAANGNVLTDERHYHHQRLFIALNIGVEDAAVQTHAGVVLLSTLAARNPEALVEDANRLAAGDALIASL